jgi:ABC-type dipeptide/oligopeptide/nickel transport system ATPase component
MTKEQFLESIESCLNKLDLHKQISNECEVVETMVELTEKFRSYCNELKQVITTIELKINYIIQFNNDLSNTLMSFAYTHHQNLQFITPQNKENIKKEIENKIPQLKEQIKLLQFNLVFFRKLNFFNNNIVAIGANGSGKTTLSNDLKRYLPHTGVVISAQKVLIIPTFSGISNFNNTNQKLLNSHTNDKSYKTTYSTENNGNSFNVMSQMGGEFQILLDNLLAERSVLRNEFCENIIRNGHSSNNVPTTKLDKALKIWNSLIQHRIIECIDGINISLRAHSNLDSYPAYLMSDGEKVILYLIAHVLQAPELGFIIVDEPEMYLHKTILKKLWDILEQERQDCIFVYLTHDLDFATSRATAKKVWIKSFNHPSNWEIENIPENELPESLLLELLGSRKNILFCEGRRGSIDEQIYNILFPHYTITPVETCFEVINYTKAFNKLPNLTTRAFGLIDSDHHGSERLLALEPENIYSMTEPENLFLDENFLKQMAKQLLHDESIVESIKSDIIKKLEDEIELQVSNYVSTKINYYFKNSHVSKGNNLAKVIENYEKFTNEIKVHDWYGQRKIEIEEIVGIRNYAKTLSLFNNKGLKTIANRHFRISDFTTKAIKFLQSQPDTQDMLRIYFPNAIKNVTGQ